MKKPKIKVTKSKAAPISVGKAYKQDIASLKRKKGRRS